MASSYKGEHITISYDDKICTHAGECVKGLPSVFNLEQDPWIQPGSTSYDDAMAVIQRCPSGALKGTPNS